MRLLIGLILLGVSFSVTAIECQVANPTASVDLVWTPPTHRAADANGVELVLKYPDEIKGYSVSWREVDELDADLPAGNLCTTEILIPTSVSASIDLQPGTRYRINMQTIDTENRRSDDSADLFFQTGGSKPPAVEDSVPNPPTNSVVITY